MSLLSETKSMISARFRGGLLDIEDIEALRKHCVSLALDWRNSKKKKLLEARENA